MAAITSAVVVAAGSAYAANRQASGAKAAARAQQRGYDSATAEQARQFDAMMEMTAPRRNVEGQALEQLAALTGLRGNRPPGEGGTPDYSAFYNSPDYQFALQQGLQATERMGSAGGNLRSGNTLAALNDYAQGRASQNFGQYVNRLAGLANMGAVDQAGQAMVAQGDRVANNMIGSANARASGVAGAANAWSNFGAQMAQLGGYGMGGGFGGGMSGTGKMLIQGANTTYQQPPMPYGSSTKTPPYIPPGSGYGGNHMMRVA